MLALRRVAREAQPSDRLLTNLFFFITMHDPRLETYKHRHKPLLHVQFAKKRIKIV
jgi:hypothetical protein